MTSLVSIDTKAIGRFNVEKFSFLSPEWIDKAREIRQAHKDDVNNLPLAIRMNQIVTNIPFDTDELKTYIDTSQGILDIELGEIENPDVSVVLDYETAKAIFVDLNGQAAIQAFMSGKIKVTGDLTKLMTLQGSIAPGEQGLKIAEEIKSITL